ncbi:thioesterase family protein [Tahibacter amnicola]|uniref:Thioesterase family protein n=1 Tax=Tahibacter amnicola TaxID=2976241 RepID=A0ABY6BER1_9GAMM|nr:thioesterase family protein [Tahibacter amnicola]UXI68229.1 thioesterase family protein [Tahibacter amnicola]
MPADFETSLFARWGDMDFNAHMANTAYLDASADVRLMYFSSRGFPAAELARLGIGPVVRRDEIDYYREVRLLEPLRAVLRLAGLNADAGRFRLQNDFYREDGQLAVRVRSEGGWLDLARRKLTAPPEALAAALRELGQTEDFVTL